MGDFEYSYEKLFGNKSQCEICHNENCSDVGKHSFYDGRKHKCSRFEAVSKEQREEDRRKQQEKEQEEEIEHWQLVRRQYGLYYCESSPRLKNYKNIKPEFK